MENAIRFLRAALVEQWPITLTAALGFVAVFILLPRPRPTVRTWGLVAAGVALLLAGALIVRAGAFSAETVLFYAFSAIAVLAGGLLVTQSNPARAALSFALVVLSTCGLFLLLAAPFLMAATTIIYAGAIIVTFLFVIMLAQQEGVSNADLRSREPLLASLTGFVLLGALLYVLHVNYDTGDLDRLREQARAAVARDSVEQIAQAIGDPPDPAREGFFVDFKKAIFAGGQSDQARDLVADIDNNVLPAWVAARAQDRPEEARKALARLEEVGLRARASLGALQPPPGTPMSNLSGPPATVPLFEAAPGTSALRRDARGSPELPHENTGYLGRALFTDYLLAVELGGTLLLVATVGAIAIAGRRGERHA